MGSGSGDAPDISVCVPVYRRHGPPNISTMGVELAAALDGLRGELIVALNGISASRAHVPHSAIVIDLHRNRGVPHAWNEAARLR
jgi:hypothetical protein